MSYSGCARVAELVPNLTGGASNLTELPSGNNPASPAFVRWLSSGCALIESQLKAMGYGTPVPGTAALYDYVSDLEATYAAWRAESARGSARSSPGERTRGDHFRKQFDEGMMWLRSQDLSRMGLDPTEQVYLGGMEADDKALDRGNSNVVQPRFVRGAFDGNFENTAAS